MRPFKLKCNGEEGLENIISMTGKLIKKGKDGKPAFPNSKIKELREILTLGESSGKIYISEMKARGRKLPEIKGRQFHEKLFDNNSTPYFDMIELIEFYPEFKMTKTEENNEEI